MRGFCILLACILVGGSAAAGIRATPVSGEEAAQWIRYTVPLPKQISITSKVILPRDDVALRCDDKGPLSIQACRELRDVVCPSRLWQDSNLPKKPLQKTTFCIALQTSGAEAEKLRALKNSDQAYCISPGENGKGLKLTALTPRGLYYASKTLQQLVRAKSTETTAVIPIVRVTDWPDLADRGFWGTDTFAHVRWLSDRKLNYVEQISAVGFDEQGKPFARVKPEHGLVVEEGPKHGIEFVPVILHLEQLGPRILAHYPNLKAQGGGQGAVCYSQPQVADILAEWMIQFGRTPGIREVDVWMSENLKQKGGCTCPECAKTDRSVLEARTILRAWEKARNAVPNLGLHILTSEETEKSNPAILKELPPDVKVWYYHSLLTYSNGKTPMLHQYLTDYARSGRYVGVVPNLDSTVHWASPFTGAGFVHYRMNEFVDKGLSGVMGYVTPRLYCFFFNAEAAAEWSWNAKGRTPHEFALSWAVRQRYRDPARFAEWADTIGPVEWDCFGSHWPSGEQRKQPASVATLLRQGKLPHLGGVLWGLYRVPFGDVKTAEQLDADVAAAGKALRLAKALNDPSIINESLIAQGYISSMKALYELGRIVTPQGIAPQDMAAARKYFRTYADSLNQVIRELPKWETSITRTDDPGAFPDKPIKTMQEMVSEMRSVATDLGIDMK